MFGVPTPGSAIRIPIDDAAGLAAELRARDFGHARPGAPAKTPWGSREFAATDPAGDRLIFRSEDPTD